MACVERRSWLLKKFSARGYPALAFRSLGKLSPTSAQLLHGSGGFRGGRGSARGWVRHPLAYSAARRGSLRELPASTRGASGVALGRSSRRFPGGAPGVALGGSSWRLRGGAPGVSPARLWRCVFSCVWGPPGESLCTPPGEDHAAEQKGVRVGVALYQLRWRVGGVASDATQSWSVELNLSLSVDSLGRSLNARP